MTSQPERILVPTDFSTTAGHALEAASSLAVARGGIVHLAQLMRTAGIVQHTFRDRRFSRINM